MNANRVFGIEGTNDSRLERLEEDLEEMGSTMLKMCDEIVRLREYIRVMERVPK